SPRCAVTATSTWRRTTPTSRASWWTTTIPRRRWPRPWSGSRSSAADSEPGLRRGHALESPEGVDDPIGVDSVHRERKPDAILSLGFHVQQVDFGVELQQSLADLPHGGGGGDHHLHRHCPPQGGQDRLQEP